MANDDDVLWLEDEEEFLISELWVVSTENSISGKSTNYSVVKDRCEFLKLDAYEVYRVCRAMTSELNKKD